MIVDTGEKEKVGRKVEWVVMADVTKHDHVSTFLVGNKESLKNFVAGDFPLHFWPRSNNYFKILNCLLTYLFVGWCKSKILFLLDVKLFF